MIINTDTLSWPTYRELDTGVFSPECSMPTIPFPQMLREPHGRGGWNTVRARGGKKKKTSNMKSVFSRHNRSTVQRNAQGLWHHVTGSVQTQTRQNPGVKGKLGSARETLPPAAVLLALLRSWKGRAKASFNGGSPNGKPCSRASPSQA